MSSGWWDFESLGSNSRDSKTRSAATSSKRAACSLRAAAGSEAAFRSIGLTPRLPVTAMEVFRFRQEYVTNRNLTAWTFVNAADPSEIVDVILTHDLAEVKSKRVMVSGRPIKIVAIDDLIRMKSEAGRPQDIEDVRALRTVK